MEAQQSQARAAFHERRRHGIGGSDAAAVVGVSPWRGPLDVWSEKVGLVEPEERDEEFLALGTVLEPYVAARYERETGLKVVPGVERWKDGLAVHPRWPWQRAHPDAVILSEARGEGVLQIKSTGFDDEEWKDGAPLHYTVQVQHEIAAADFQWGVLAVLFGAPAFHFRFFEFERDHEFIGALTETEAEFWRHVEEKIQPTATALDNAVLRRLYPGVTGEEIALPTEAAEWDLDYLRGADLEKQGRELKAQAKALIAQALGEAARGKLPGGNGVYRRAIVNKREYTVAASSYVDLRRVSK